MKRPILAVAASVLITRLAYEQPMYINAQHLVTATATGIIVPGRSEAVELVVRNVVLLGAAIDAAATLVRNSEIVRADA